MTVETRVIRSKRRNRHRVVHSIQRNIQAVREGPDRLHNLEEGDETSWLMSPSYAEQIMLDAQAGHFPEADDLVRLAKSYLTALECISSKED